MLRGMSAPFEKAPENSHINRIKEEDFSLVLVQITTTIINFSILCLDTWDF